MSYEFKKLSDVEVVETPADIANVLIEEDGVIKKAPKTAVGGAGTDDYDVIVRGTPILVDWGSDGWGIDGVEYTLEKGDYETLKAKIKSYKPLSGLYIYEVPEDSLANEGEFPRCTDVEVGVWSVWRETRDPIDGFNEAIFFDTWYNCFIILPDNTVIND